MKILQIISRKWNLTILKISSLSLIIFIFTSLLISGCSPRPTWEENFDNLDKNTWSIWDIEHNPHFDAIKSWDAIEVSRGTLKIKPFIKNGIYYTGMISTEHSFRAANGRYEIKCKLKSASGIWSDVWLYNRSVAKE